MPMLTTDKQRAMTAGVERTIHRIRGMQLWLQEHLNAEEANADDAGWGDFQTLTDLERTIAEYIARTAYTEVYRDNEDMAREQVLANVDPEGEAYFSPMPERK